MLFEGLNLTFKSGRTLLLGPNGSGKSTILGLASGSISPKAGSVKSRSSVGLLPQKIPIFPHLNVREQVAYVAWLAMKPMKSSEIEADYALSAMNLLEKKLDKPKSLSGGQLRRLGIAGLLNSDVDIMLLDEPTAGLDIAQCSNFYQTLRGIPSSKSVVVSTHQLEGITDFFDNVIVIKSGQLVFDGTMSEFILLGTYLENQINTNVLVNAYASLIGVGE